MRLAVRERDSAALIEALAAVAPFSKSEIIGEEKLVIELLVGDRESAAVALASQTRESETLEIEALLLAAGAQERSSLGARYRSLAAKAKDSSTQAQLLGRAASLGFWENAKDASAMLASALALQPTDPGLARIAADFTRDRGDVDLCGTRERCLADRVGQGATAHLLFVDPAGAARGLGELKRGASTDLELLVVERELASPSAQSRAQASYRLARALTDPSLRAREFKEAAARFVEADDLTTAAVCYRAALDADPADLAVYELTRGLLQEIYEETHDPGPLLELFTHRLESIEPSSREDESRALVLLERARLLRYERDYRGAEADLRRLVELRPADLEALRELAEILAISPLGTAIGAGVALSCRRRRARFRASA